jgi:hypothetical protein
VTTVSEEGGPLFVIFIIFRFGKKKGLPHSITRLIKQRKIWGGEQRPSLLEAVFSSPKILKIL